MAFFVDEERKFVVYESPKTGGTTLRSWINYAGTGELELSGSKDYYHESANVYRKLDDWGYSYDEFREFDSFEKICIKRDPVKRFVSCYTDKIVRENHIPDCDLGFFINNIEEVVSSHPFMHPSLPNKSIGFLWYHFVPQTYHLGADSSYYDLVVDTSEIETKLKPYLEGKWEITLPSLHTRRQTIAKPEIDSDQENIIREYYHEDYTVGWF